MSVGSAKPMEDAARISYADLIEWMVDDYGFKKWMLISSYHKLENYM